MLAVVISKLSVMFAEPPNGHYMGHALNPAYLRMDAIFSTKGTYSLRLHFSIVCGAARKKFEAWFTVGPSLPRGAYAILDPLPSTYTQLLSFYNKECGCPKAVMPDLSKFFHDERTDRVSVKVQGPGKHKVTLYLDKYES